MKKYPTKKSINDGALFYKIYNENAIDMKNIREFHNWKKSNVNKNNINVIQQLAERFLKKVKSTLLLRFLLSFNLIIFANHLFILLRYKQSVSL